MGENKKEVKARKKAFRKAKHRAIRPWKGLSIVCAILAVIFVPLYSLLNVFDNSLAIFVGGTFWKLKNEDQSAQYFTSDLSLQKIWLTMDYSLFSRWRQRVQRFL